MKFLGALELPSLTWILQTVRWALVRIYFVLLGLLLQLPLGGGVGQNGKHLFASFSAREFPNWCSPLRETFLVLVEAGLLLYPLRYHVSHSPAGLPVGRGRADLSVHRLFKAGKLYSRSSMGGGTQRDSHTRAATFLILLRGMWGEQALLIVGSCPVKFEEQNLRTTRF